MSEINIESELENIKVSLKKDLLNNNANSALLTSIETTYLKNPKGLSLYLTALKHYDKGELFQASVFFEQSLIHNPQNFIAYELLGDTYFRLTRWEKAKQSYQKSKKIFLEYASKSQKLGELNVNIVLCNKKLEV